MFNDDGTGEWGPRKRVITWKYVGKGEKGSSKFLFTFDDDKTSETATVVDGEIDAGTWVAGRNLLGNEKKKEVDENADQKAQIFGKWKRGGAVVEFKKNGTFTDSRNVNGTWDCNADGSFSMTWSDSGVTVNCSKPDKNFSFESGASTNKMEKIIK